MLGTEGPMSQCVEGQQSENCCLWAGITYTAEVRASLRSPKSWWGFLLGRCRVLCLVAECLKTEERKCL